MGWDFLVELKLELFAAPSFWTSFFPPYRNVRGINQAKFDITFLVTSIRTSFICFSFFGFVLTILDFFAAIFFLFLISNWQKFKIPLKQTKRKLNQAKPINRAFLIFSSRVYIARFCPFGSMNFVFSCTERWTHTRLSLPIINTYTNICKWNLRTHSYKDQSREGKWVKLRYINSRLTTEIAIIEH